MYSQFMLSSPSDMSCHSNCGCFPSCKAQVGPLSSAQSTSPRGQNPDSAKMPFRPFCSWGARARATASESRPRALATGTVAGQRDFTTAFRRTKSRCEDRRRKAWVTIFLQKGIPRSVVYKKHREIETSLSLVCVSYFLIVKFQKD